MALDPISSITDLATTVISRIWPDKTEEEKAKLAQQFAVLQAQISAQQGQLEIDKAEATNESTFVAGWRPFIGWACGLACVWNWMGLPVAKLILTAAGHPIPVAPADLSQMMPVLMGMLGLGGLHTYERVKGVSR